MSSREPALVGRYGYAGCKPVREEPNRDRCEQDPDRSPGLAAAFREQRARPHPADQHQAKPDRDERLEPVEACRERHGRKVRANLMIRAATPPC